MKKFHKHIYLYSYDTGFYIYKQCRCGKRKVVRPEGGYQPLDREWLETATAKEAKGK